LAVRTLAQARCRCIDLRSPNFGPRCSARGSGPRTMKNIIDASPRLRGEKVFLKPIRSSSARMRQQDSPASVPLQGGGQAVHLEFALAVDRCSEVHRWDFDPMLVEVDACLAKPQAGLTSQAVEVAQAVDLCPNECGSGQTSPWPSLVEPEQARDPYPRSRLTSRPSRKVPAEAARQLRLPMVVRLTRRPQHRSRTSLLLSRSRSHRLYCRRRHDCGEPRRRERGRESWTIQSSSPRGALGLPPRASTGNRSRRLRRER
jgi:hypothetical protein